MSGQTLESIRIDADVPANVPKDRVVDMTFAMGGVPNDLVDPYLPVAWMTEAELPRLLYQPVLGASAICVGMIEEFSD